MFPEFLKFNLVPTYLPAWQGQGYLYANEIGRLRIRIAAKHQSLQYIYRKPPSRHLLKLQQMVYWKFTFESVRSGSGVADCP